MDGDCAAAWRLRAGRLRSKAGDGGRFPTYFNDWLFIQRALYDDSYEAPEELKAFARAWEDKVLRGISIEKSEIETLKPAA